MKEKKTPIIRKNRPAYLVSDVSVSQSAGYLLNVFQEKKNA